MPGDGRWDLILSFKGLEKGLVVTMKNFSQVLVYLVCFLNTFIILAVARNVLND